MQIIRYKDHICNTVRSFIIFFTETQLNLKSWYGTALYMHLHNSSHSVSCNMLHIIMKGKQKFANPL